MRIPLPPGERLLWYRISAVLGRGRSGFTYLARDLTLDREVVIKECLPEGIAARLEGSVVRPLAPGEDVRFAEALRSFLAAAQGVAIAKGAHLVGMLNAFEDRREQLRMRSEQQAKRDRKREHPLPHRHPGDDVIDQVGGGLPHAPGATARAETATLATEGHELSWAQSAQRRRNKPRAKMPQSRKASNSSLTNSGNPAPVSSSTRAREARSTDRACLARRGRKVSRCSCTRW